MRLLVRGIAWSGRRNEMVRTKLIVMISLMTLGLNACSELPTAATSAVVTLTASPSPSTAVTSSNAAYAWGTAFTVTVAETGGVGVTVGAVTIKVQQASGGIVIVPTSDVVEVYRLLDLKTSGNRVEAKTTAGIGFDVAYTLPNGGREALVTVSVSLTDDNGNTATQSVQVRVT